MCDCLTVLGGKCDPYLSTNHISTDDGNLPFLVEPVETIYLGLDFHCKTLELKSGCYCQHLQEVNSRDVSARGLPQERVVAMVGMSVIDYEKFELRFCMTIQYLMKLSLWVIYLVSFDPSTTNK